MDNKLLIEKEKQIADQISDKYHYDSNIRHFLYLIIPAFIVKYGMKREKLILKVFSNVRIVISNEKRLYEKASYYARPHRNGNRFFSSKNIFIYNYGNLQVVDLLDSLIHEYNHAVNSYINQIKTDRSYLYLRTGISHMIYDKRTLRFVEKENTYMLEEIINTKQTSDIINIIKSFDISDRDISNTIYAINSETGTRYDSNSYFVEGYACKTILENRTFIKTLEQLRIDGNVDDVVDWFDNIMGKSGSFRELTNLLVKVYDLEIEYSKRRIFKNMTINKIRECNRQIKHIVDEFNNNVIYS